MSKVKGLQMTFSPGATAAPPPAKVPFCHGAKLDVILWQEWGFLRKLTVFPLLCVGKLAPHPSALWFLCMCLEIPSTLSTPISLPRGFARWVWVWWWQRWWEEGVARLIFCVFETFPLLLRVISVYKLHRQILKVCFCI
jgi:hypothetical protein